jgi:hypothetical protein
LLQITVSYKKKLSAVTPEVRAVSLLFNKPTRWIEKLACEAEAPALGFADV